MEKKSAGILVYRKRNDIYQFFLAHPGGPFWAKKDVNSWSIPKGEFTDEEEPFEAAKREFKEETGFEIEGDFISLPIIKQPSGKIVFAWAVEGDIDESEIVSNTFELEWPPKSGIIKHFPEIDKCAWFSTEIAKQKILKGQIPFIEEMIIRLDIKTKEINKLDNDGQFDLFLK